MASVDPTLTTVVAPSVDLVAEPAWIALKAAATALQGLQIKNGSIPESESDAGASKSATFTSAHTAAAAHVATICSSIEQLAPHFPHDASYLATVIADFGRWVDGGFGEPDFLASILEFAPAAHRVAGIRARDLRVCQIVAGRKITRIESRRGVNRSFDLLTTDAGYRIGGVPVNSMIEEMLAAC